MQVFELSNVANQAFTITPEGYTYRFVIRYFRDMMYVSIYNQDGEPIANSVRGCDREWLIPFEALNYTGAGNFMFVDSDESYPDFRNFGDACVLTYYTREEIENGETE